MMFGSIPQMGAQPMLIDQWCLSQMQDRVRALESELSVEKAGSAFRDERNKALVKLRAEEAHAAADRLDTVVRQRDDAERALADTRLLNAGLVEERDDMVRQVSEMRADLESAELAMRDMHARMLHEEPKTVYPHRRLVITLDIPGIGDQAIHPHAIDALAAWLSSGEQGVHFQAKSGVDIYFNAWPMVRKEEVADAGNVVRLWEEDAAPTTAGHEKASAMADILARLETLEVHSNLHADRIDHLALSMIRSRK